MDGDIGSAGPHHAAQRNIIVFIESLVLILR